MIGYATEAELTAYATARGYTLVGDEAVDLTLALDWLESNAFAGYKTDPEQTLEFPRNGDTDVPEKIKQAQLAAALLVDQGVDLLAPIGPKVTQETVFGAVSVSYSDRGSVVTLYPQLLALIREFLGAGAGSTFGVIRG